MNHSSHTPINDELLSAYIDGVVSDEERVQVEAALAVDPALAWELDTLRRTVELMRDLPPLALPRSFVLTEEQVADVLDERRTANPASTTSRPHALQTRGAEGNSFWRDLLAFFGGGNLLLRNAAAIAALFFVIVFVAAPSTPLATPSTETMAYGTQSEAMPAAEAQPPVEAPVQASEMPSSVAQADSAQEAVLKTTSAEAPPISEVPESETATQPALAQMEEAPPNSEARAASAALRTAPDGPAALSMPMGRDAMGGGVESGEAAMQAAPAEMYAAEPAPASFPEASAAAEASTAPVEAEALLKTSISDESAASALEAESVAMESTASPTAVQNAVALAPGEVESTQSDTPDQTTPKTASPAPEQNGWSVWQLLQTGLGGLVLLFGLLWIRSRSVESNRARTP